MRIITWNVNALRTVLPYRPWNELQDKTIGGMLNAMNAEIICFQEHKGRRDQMNKGMATPPNFDAFFSFPYGKGGYSGTCVYTKMDFVIPLKAEEGITGLLLDGPSSCVLGSTNRAGLPTEHRVGCYADEDDIKIVDEVDGGHFDLKRLDMEGRAVVLDFGLFVLFNLYCPNETNDSRLPYKLNYLYMLQARIARLMAAGREVIVVGDINVCHRPIDNGEGGIQRAANEHFEHPARQWFDAWVRDDERGTGILIDVTRRSWPKRKGMFTCWNQKLDARPSNYGARIDYILVSPGLLPWVKESDIQPDVMGSDHCPVYVDFHETISDPSHPDQTLVLRNLLNPTPRIALPTAVQAVADPLRTLPQPPPFATCFWDEFSAKQRNLSHFFAKKGPNPPPAVPVKRARERSVQPAEAQMSLSPKPAPATGDTKTSGTSGVKPQSASGSTASLADSPIIDISDDEERPNKRPSLSKGRSTSTGANGAGKKAKQNGKPAQAGIQSFFSRTPGRSASVEQPDKDKDIADEAMMNAEEATRKASPPPSNDVDADFLFAKSLAEAEESDDRLAASQGAEEDRAEVAGTWSNIFAKKVPPRCIVHGEVCKPYTSKVTTSKGRKFWLCSRPVGPGYDSGRSKRPRNEVNHEWRCDFFLWDSALKNKEQPSPSAPAKR